MQLSNPPPSLEAGARTEGVWPVRSVAVGCALLTLSVAWFAARTRPAVPPDGSIATLAAALSDSDSAIRRQAGAALVRFGPRAAGAVPALVAALSDPDLVVRSNAGLALTSVGPAAAVPLIDTLSVSQPRARQHA